MLPWNFSKAKRTFLWQMFPQDFSIEEMIQKRIRIEELLFDLKSDHFSEIKTLVHILKKNIVQQILQKSWSINIFNYKIYGDLFAILNFNDIIIPIHHSKFPVFEVECEPDVIGRVFYELNVLFFNENFQLTQIEQLHHLRLFVWLIEFLLERVVFERELENDVVLQMEIGVQNDFVEILYFPQNFILDELVGAFLHRYVSKYRWKGDYIKYEMNKKLCI